MCCRWQKGRKPMKFYTFPCDCVCCRMWKNFVNSKYAPSSVCACVYRNKYSIYWRWRTAIVFHISSHLSRSHNHTLGSLAFYLTRIHLCVLLWIRRKKIILVACEHGVCMCEIIYSTAQTARYTKWKRSLRISDIQAQMTRLFLFFYFSHSSIYRPSNFSYLFWLPSLVLSCEQAWIWQCLRDCVCVCLLIFCLFHLSDLTFCLSISFIVYISSL